MSGSGEGRARARRAAEEEGERRGKGERKERKGGKERKEKENGKKKKKKKSRGERREKGEREGGIRAGITALIAEPVGHAWRPGARERDAQVEGKQGWDSGRFGCRLGSSGYREVRREMIQEGDRAQRRNKILAHDLF